MSGERVEPETLAAFLDGNLNPAERERVLKILAESPEEHEVFVDAARAASALGDRSVVPIETARRRTNHWLVAIPAFIAAGIAAVVVVPRLEGGGRFTPMELASQLSVVSAPGAGSLAARLGDNWDQPGWSVMRGANADVAESARAFRVGARATDVEIAIRAEDSTALQLVGTELIELVSGVDAGAASVAQYRRILATGISASESDRRAAAAALRSLMRNAVWFDLGAWIEAARVAAVAGNVGYLRSTAGSLTQLTDAVESDTSPLRDEVSGLLRSLDPVLRLAGPLTTTRQQSIDLLTKVIVTVGR